MLKTLAFIRHNAIALAALFVALGREFLCGTLDLRQSDPQPHD